MPTPDDSMLNPMTDLLETDEQKAKRLVHEKKMRELLAQLPTKDDLQQALAQGQGEKEEK